MNKKYSIVEYFSGNSGSSCGYCKNESTSISQGMWAHSMTVKDYQALIDRGWRRSGKYVYKPTMSKTCCPQYPIRLPVQDFQLSKSHRKVLKRNNKYFNSGIKPSNHELPSVGDVDMLESCHESQIRHHEVQSPEISTEQSTAPHSRLHDTSYTDQHATASPSDTLHRSDSSPRNALHRPESSQKKTPKPGEGADPSKPKCVKAKQRRLERRQQKGLDVNRPSAQDNELKSLKAYIDEVSPEAKHKLEIRLVRSNPQSKVFQDTFSESYSLYKKYQITVHGDAPEKLDEKKFMRFLVDSPLEAEYPVDGFSDGYGSFHQQYLLDGRIVAVGVVDILSHCVSSVYLYYDPDYRFLSLGIYSALREIAFTKSIHAVAPLVQYYYMGFYIHSCPKMRYKGQYKPSHLLCPETYQWWPLEECAPKLDAVRYSRLSPEGEVDTDKPNNVDSVLCLYMGKIFRYAMYQAMSRAKDEAQVQEYANLVGISCAKGILLYRQDTDD